MDVKQLRMLLGKYPDDYEVVVRQDIMPTLELKVVHEIKQVSYKRVEEKVVDIVIKI